MAGKAIATAAAKKGLTYGAKEAWKAAKRKKKKIVRDPRMTYEDEGAMRRVLGI